ncbi:uncharacterized protein G2W53_018259 [Senna tora]|uniref:Uncharacterized protein n=1 Tax=Senna tora TaxID=362788 RepID=A0A834TVL6_9FABA|nr:uncharacterized protein G2W53_018259 [Senna tora]
MKVTMKTYILCIFLGMLLISTAATDQPSKDEAKAIIRLIIHHLPLRAVFAVAVSLGLDLHYCVPIITLHHHISF